MSWKDWLFLKLELLTKYVELPNLFFTSNMPAAIMLYRLLEFLKK